jgi:hypothetical protein
LFIEPAPPARKGLASNHTGDYMQYLINKFHGSSFLIAWIEETFWLLNKIPKNLSAVTSISGRKVVVMNWAVEDKNWIMAGG